MTDGYFEQSGTMNDKTVHDAEISQLVRVINNNVQSDGIFSQPIPGLHIRRYSKTGVDWEKAFYLPSVLIVAQGVKTVMLDKEAFQIGKSRMFMIPVALPVSLRTIQATAQQPFIGIGLTLDPEKIAEFVPKVYPRGLPSVPTRCVGYTAEADAGIINAVTRLIECLHHPSDTELLAPIVKDEILMRLLLSPIGINIAEMGFADTSVRQVAKAIEWLRSNFIQPMKVSELASLSHMSVSIFHKHFKAVTSMSPLKYQKELRLQEARNLMLSKKMDAITASQWVGYASASQFSRDYRSYFGNPPGRDMARLHSRLTSEVHQ
ncbi:AraC family transcriptional regulator [Paenibacillus sp. HW567]|uniref:AraC family transcriptional regulator n=1 Tax=Paenibacillus sp. HW567 TaxID=1034769 RepID=UPI000379DBE3|nr:AraC family transcriptional regulator [Paenibacillus sp. HW567]